MTPDRDVRLWRLWGRADILLQVAVALAVIAAIKGSPLLAFGVLAAVAARVVAHVGVAVVAYRRTMRRPWPEVEPLRDDDGW